MKQLKSDGADRRPINCTSSQINYVINTRLRFNSMLLSKAVVISTESKSRMIDLFQKNFSEREGNHLLLNLYENKLITKREAQMMSPWWRPFKREECCRSSNMMKKINRTIGNTKEEKGINAWGNFYTKSKECDGLSRKSSFILFHCQHLLLGLIRRTRRHAGNVPWQGLTPRSGNRVTTGYGPQANGSVLNHIQESEARARKRIQEGCA